MANRIEIVLKTANNQPVSLKKMTPEALDSFMSVVSSLKDIATSSGTNIIFTISEGSAKCAVSSPENEVEVDNMYKGIDLAIKGESKDKIYTKNTKSIQDQLQRIGYDFKIVYTNEKYEIPQVIPIHERLKSAKKIVLKRTKSQFEYKLRVVSGFLNQIGGNTPNYHFDYGHNNKITISCSKEEAIDIKKYLYQDINVLILCKEWITKDKNEYTHRILLEQDKVNIHKTFFSDYYRLEDIIERLGYMHDFFYNQIKNNRNGIEVLRQMLIAFNNDNFQISEIKTLLIISKPFRDKELIKEERALLLETYEKMCNKIR